MYQGGRRRRSHDYLRSCDYCGRLVLRSSMVKKDNYLACKDDARGRERVTLDKANAANVTPRMWKPARSRLSDRDNEIDVYQADEAAAFNAICVTQCIGADGVARAGLAPYELIDVSGNGPGTPIALATQATETARCAGWSIDYLYGVITENKRPQTWLTNARSTVIRLANWLLAHQFTTGGVGDFSTSSSSSWFGGFPRTGVSGTTAIVYAEDQGIALLGLLRAYQLTGTITYLLAARNAATCLRRMQCGGLRSSGSLVASASGGTWVPAAPSSQLTVSRSAGVFATSSHGTDFYPRDLIGLEAMALLKSVDGDSTYGDATAVGEFSSATAATLTTAMTQFRNFWAADWLDSDSQFRQGLSSATPREFYRVSYSTSPAMPSWQYAWSNSSNGYVTSLNFATGLRALNATEGYSSQVADVCSWIRGLTGPSFTTPAGYSPMQIDESTLGTFSASVAPPAEIAVPLNGTKAVVGAYFFVPLGGGTNAAGNYLSGPAYDFAAAGMLAAIRAPNLKTLKDLLGVKRRRNWETTATSIQSA